MREALIAIIASVIVGLSTFYVEEHLFAQEQASLVETLTRVIDIYADQLESCHASCYD